MKNAMRGRGGQFVNHIMAHIGGVKKQQPETKKGDKMKKR